MTQVKDPVRSPPFIPSLRVELGSSSALVFGDVRGGYGGLVAPRAIHTGARLGLNDLFSLFWDATRATEPNQISLLKSAFWGVGVKSRNRVLGGGTKKKKRG